MDRIKLLTGMECPLGTISEGTLRHIDLIEACSDFLDYYAHESFLSHAEEWRDDDFRPIYCLEQTLEDLFERIDAVVPAGFYFGSHPGDGADFGIWKAECCDVD